MPGNWFLSEITSKIYWRLFRALIYHLQNVRCLKEDYEKECMDLDTDERNGVLKEDTLLEIKEWLDNNILSNTNIRFSIKIISFISI